MRILFPLALLTLALAAPSAVQAAEKTYLYKCSDPAGVISIQSDPCAKGSTEVWKRDTAPEPTPTPEQKAQAEAKRQRDQQTVRELSEEVDRRLRPKPKPEPAPEPEPEKKAEAAPSDRCTQAQDFAGQLRGKQWLGLSEEQMQRVYGWVSEQCKPEPPAD